MRPASCGITPEGWPTIGITALTALVFACLDWPVPAVLALALCWFAFHFFRDPERVVPTAPGLAVSPAGAQNVILVAWVGDGGKNADNRHHNHQFNQGKSLLSHLFSLQ